MVKFGVHVYLFCGDMTQAGAWMQHIRDLGFEGVEVNLRHLEHVHPEEIMQRAGDLDLTLICSSGLHLHQDLASQDAHQREAGVAYLKRCIDVSLAMGARQYSGVLYSPPGKPATCGPSETEWSRVGEELRKVAEYARARGLPISIEPLNRYETHFINTMEDAVKMVRLVDCPGFGIHPDTYHMNIEEKGFYDPIVQYGEHITHFHACESDRGIPGTGNVDWDQVFQGLRTIGYARWIMLESFTSLIPSMAAVTRIWRRLAPNPSMLAREGLAFLKQKALEYDLIKQCTGESA